MRKNKDKQTSSTERIFVTLPGFSRAFFQPSAVPLTSLPVVVSGIQSCG